MNETKKSFEFVENEHNTIIRTTGITEIDNGKKNAYDILVGKKIPEGESIIDYCYNQFDTNLMDTLSENGFPEEAFSSFCSGTCAAMILAISRGDSSIRPEDVAVWNKNGKINWINGIGINDWEQEEDLNGDGGQIYDNRYKGANGVWKYKSLDIDEEGNAKDLETEEAYLKDIKIFLSAGLPVIIDVGGHFVVVVGVESDIKLEEAEFKDLVIFDPGAYRDNIENEKYKIVTLDESKEKYNHATYRMLTPFPVITQSEYKEAIKTEYYPDMGDSDPLDDEWSFVADENGKKTHDPYYIDPVRKFDKDKSIIPAKQGRPLKEAIKAVDYYYPDMPEDEREEIIKGLIKVFTGEDAESVYESLTVTENGEYEPEDDVTAFNKVVVDVKANVKSKDITKNGKYKAASEKAEGFDVVNVNVPDRGDEAEKYKKLWEAANDIIIKIDVHIPDPSDPGNPDSGENYVFEQAIDIGENVQPNEFLPMLIKKGKVNGDIIDIRTGLCISYTSGAQEATLTITNLHNGQKSTRVAELNWVGVYTRIASIGVGSNMVSGSAVRLDDEGREITGQGMYLYFSSIGFTPPADWKPYYIVV